METKDFISSGLLELYVLGLTSAEETLEVETMLGQHPEVVEEMSAIGLALENYAIAHAITPGTGMKKNIQAQLSQPGQISQKGKVISMQPWLKWVAAASVILLLGSTVFNVIYVQKYQQAELARTEAETRLYSLEEENNSVRSSMNVVQSKFSEPVSLHGLEASPEAAAKIFWMKNTGEVYVDPSNLPPAPPGKQYQLWGIVDGKPVDGGMISPEKPGMFKVQKMKTFGRAEAFAITLETMGGNPAPKGDMYVMGKI